MKIAVVGSRTFPVVATGRALCDWLNQYPPDTVVYTRGSKGFDEFMTEVARIYELKTVVMKGKGGADNYIRDAELVAAVDEVHAFFPEDELGQGGTQHVVDKSLDAGKPCYSYTDRGPEIVLVGSSDHSSDSDSAEDESPPPPEATGEGEEQFAGSWASGTREG